MDNTSTGRPALVAVMSILAILAVTLAVGILLMQKQDNPNITLGTALSSRQVSPTETDDFDPISWARDGAAYPPLETPDDSGEFVADYTGDGALPSDEEPTAPVVTTQPAAVSPPPEPVAEPTFREIRENAYWVQVFSTDTVSKAEAVRDSLSARGLPANVVIKDVEGTTWYRVRIGAFEGEGEAEGYAEKARAIEGFESSYVVQAPVTRRIPTDN